MNVRSRRGIAILAVLVFVAVALPLVIILMNLLATHRSFGTAQYSREMMSNYANNGIEEGVRLIFSQKPYLVSCDSNGRVNDQWEWVNPTQDFDYLAAYWIRWPFVQAARIYGTLGSMDPDLSATSLIAYPWYVYRDESPLADCVPDDLSVSGSAYTPVDNFRLVVAFAPYGRRNVLYPLLTTPPGYPGDYFWPPTPGSSLPRLNGTASLTDSLFASVRTWLTDPRVLPMELSYSGQLNPGASDRFNAYRRSSVFDPLLPAEGFSLPTGNMGLLDNTTGQLLQPALGGTTTFDPATDGIPSGYEVSISDEGARLPIYDWFHNADDALFYNPFDYGTPAAPFASILNDLPQDDLLMNGWFQQVRSLGYLVKGLGINPTQFVPARALITHIGYYDIGDQGRPQSGTNRDYPDGYRSDFDGNGTVDEPMTMFPSSLKQILDANRILSEPPTNGNSYRNEISENFEYFRAQATAIRAPLNAYQDIEDPLIRRAYDLAGSSISSKYPIWKPWLGWPTRADSVCPASQESEPNDTPASADPAGILCVHEGTVRKVNANCTGASDCDDWWTFTPTRARQVDIFLFAPDPNPNANVRLTLEGPLGTVLGSVTAPGGGGQATLSGISLQMNTTYYVHIEPVNTPPAEPRGYRFIIQIPGRTVCRNVFIRLQDCLISEYQPLSMAEYNNYLSMGGAWRDPAFFYPFWLRTVLNRDHDGNGTADIQQAYNELFNYFTPLTNSFVANLLSQRHIGHWGAWQYYYRYIPEGTTLFECLGIGANRRDEHARYHGIGDVLLPVPTPGPWYDPGNVLNTANCNAGPGGDRRNWPTIYAPVDVDGNGIFDPANPSNPYDCVSEPGRDCMKEILPEVGGEAVYEIQDRLPSPVTYDASRQRFADETLFFQLAASVLEGTSPYLTYFDSNAPTVDTNGQGFDPNPLNEICDPQGLRIVPGTQVTEGVGILPAGQYYPADGRSDGNVYTDPYTGQPASMADLCVYSPDVWPDQLAESERPRRFRLRININTATVHTLAALSAKFSNANVSVSQTRSSRFAQSITLYREWFYRTPNLSMNHVNHGILAGWLNDPTPYDDGFLNLNPMTSNTSSLLTSYLFNILSNPTLRPIPLLAPFDWNNTDLLIQGKLAFPNDRLNPPFRNIGQLFDVRYVTSRLADPRDIDEDTGSCRVLSILQNCDPVPVGDPNRAASDAARFFARIDQDIAVKSYGYRIESFGRLGNNLQQKAIILTRSFSSGEMEWQQQDLTPIATRYY